MAFRGIPGKVGVGSSGLFPHFREPETKFNSSVVSIVPPACYSWHTPKHTFGLTTRHFTKLPVKTMVVLTDSAAYFDPQYAELDQSAF